MKTLLMDRVNPGKKLQIIVLTLLLSLTGVSCQNNSRAMAPPAREKKIKIALLLDTSNSMDGLIDQAKSQLWNVVNELSRAKCDNIRPRLEIALYEYGNDNLSPREGYIRLVTPLTNDLDEISKDLFELTTNGGSEFCGQVIQTSLRQLGWGDSGEDLQLIFIAGNEPFTQGNIDFRDACYEAKSKKIIVNTIFCGNFDEGIQTSWKKGAEITTGNYMSIEQDRKTVYIESPYDKEIETLNRKLNDTYVAYGSIGKEKKMNQCAQDDNARSYGSVNAVKRAVSKSSHVYENSSWDLVDAAKDEDFEIDKIAKEDLPSEMQQMNTAEQKKYIEEKQKEREQISMEILELNKKREIYVAEKQKEAGNDNMLDNAMIKAIHTQANAMSFVFE